MIKAIVTDIEGTTSSIRFVHDVLFPYAREHMAAFLHAHAREPAVSAHIDDVRRHAGEALDLDGVIQKLIAWIDADKKITPLKALQGMIWETGFRDGDFTGHIYEDAARCLARWHARGIVLAVFSSGSTKAQRLLFSHSDVGDLTPLFRGFYDTRIGAKHDASAYATIARDMCLPPVHILFLSDIAGELNAARAAGMHTRWLVRDRQPDPAADHRQVKDFDAVASDLEGF
uniref:Enolase-phosphatase E1 n=1 Tax=Candidatus Kentrum sp. MB TaxID=2138164 RepID=A0A451B8X3_9GAMM|nr:MAG: acireductone synthase [Candidatus Kentron sp. MB]VFK29312.1 MAG: acireductone synthase [Candidatus Kentron sp. MB]VFK74743.1 MAG: acireductone synthase [Candidatus Kentron sp. MB]